MTKIEITPTDTNEQEIPVAIKHVGSSAVNASGGEVAKKWKDPDDWSQDPFYEDVKQFSE